MFQSNLKDSPVLSGDSNPSRFGTLSLYGRSYSRFLSCVGCGSSGDCDNRLLFDDVLLHPLIRKCKSCSAGYAELAYVGKSL